MEESIVDDKLVNNDLFSQREKNALYSIVKGIYLFSHLREKKSFDEIYDYFDLFSLAEKKPQIYRNLGNLLCQDSLRELAFLTLHEEAFTFATISGKVNQPRPTLYRNINNLMALGLLTTSFPIHNMRGRSVIVYQTPDASPEVISRICELHKKATNPMFLSAKKVKQQILDNYPFITTRHEITYRELLELMKNDGVNNRLQIIDLVATDLIQDGVKVWR